MFYIKTRSSYMLQVNIIYDHIHIHEILKVEEVFFFFEKTIWQSKIYNKLNLVDAARVLWWYEVVCAFYTAAHFSHTKRTLQFIHWVHRNHRGLYEFIF